jgi:hypothetical protein
LNPANVYLPDPRRAAQANGQGDGPERQQCDELGARQDELISRTPTTSGATVGGVSGIGVVPTSRAPAGTSDVYLEKRPSHQRCVAGD